MRRILIIAIALLGFGGNLFQSAQMVKVKGMNLKYFPEIEVTVSVESVNGFPLFVNKRGFKLFEEARQRPLSRIDSLQDVQLPVYSVIIIDKSGSMKGEALKRAQKGAAEFIRMMRKQDKAAFIKFDTQVNVVLEFTQDHQQLIKKISQIKTGTDTAFLDGVHAGLHLMKKVPENSVRLILVLTDGRDNRSTHNLKDVVEKAKSERISIYTIGLGKNIDPVTLREVASKTEGNYYHAPNPGSLMKIYQKISQLIHSQFLLKYRSHLSMDNGWHRMTITVPYLGKELKGEKYYLLATESRIPTTMLRRIREEQNKDASNRLEELEIENQKKEEQLVFWLSILLSFMVLFLLMVIGNKKKQRRKKQKKGGY